MIRDHTGSCIDCRGAFEAAQLSSLLMKQRANEAAELSAQANSFFQTRVLAAWREQQFKRSAWSFGRLWNATGALVASMAATTAALAVLTFVAPANDTSNQATTAVAPYSAEAIVLDQDQDDTQMTNDQVLSAVYEEDEGQ